MKRSALRDYLIVALNQHCPHYGLSYVTWILKDFRSLWRQNPDFQQA